MDGADGQDREKRQRQPKPNEDRDAEWDSIPEPDRCWPVRGNGYPLLRSFSFHPRWCTTEPGVQDSRLSKTKSWPLSVTGSRQTNR